MKYMIVIYGSQTAWDALSEADVDELAKTHVAIKSELTQTGEMIAASELDTEGARTVRQQDGGTVVAVDGPFTEGEQVLGGYYMIDCVDIDRATEIASKFAELKFA